MVIKRTVQTVKANPKKTAVGGAAALAILIATPLIMKFEGKRNDPYLDLVNRPTICFGETNVPMRHYSDSECTDMLKSALETDYAPKVLACAPGLQGHPFETAAAISLSYNIGTGMFCRSTSAQRFNAGDMRGGCQALGWFTRAGGRVIAGLVRRRKEEVALCLKGTGG